MFLVKFMELLNLTEKDLIAILFFGTAFIVMLVCWVVEDGLKWYGDRVRIDASFIIKVALIPLLSLILWIQGADRKFRVKRISEFLYA